MMAAQKLQTISVGATRYFTGIPCKRGHIAERKVSSGDCIECVKLAAKRERERNPDQVASRQRRYASKHPEEISAKSRRWYRDNTAQAKRTRRLWRERNADKDRNDIAAYQAAHREHLKAATKKWQQENWHKVLASAAKRRSVKLCAIPAWADSVGIEKVYEASRAITLMTGEAHHVDHIVPLQSSLVCGLHCEANLQILHGIENRRKSNRFWPDMPE